MWIPFGWAIKRPKKKTKKARGIQDASPTKATSGFGKRRDYKTKQKQMRGLYQRLVAMGKI